MQRHSSELAAMITEFDLDRRSDWVINTALVALAIAPLLALVALI